MKEMKEMKEMKNVRKNKPRSQNARVHGLHAKDFLLPWDSRDDFVKLHEELRAEFFPRGRAEEEAVLDLAIAHWNKHTLWRMRQSAVLKDPFTSDIVQTGRNTWRGIRKQLRASARSADSLQDVAKDILSSLRSELEHVQREIEQTSDREEIKKLEHKMGALCASSPTMLRRSFCS